MDRPTLRQLEAFDAIAATGSFRAAARSLGISQVAVSDHIRELESRLGVQLFDRSRGERARLSTHGEAALPRARLVLADCDALLAAMDAAEPALPGELLTTEAEESEAGSLPAEAPVPAPSKPASRSEPAKWVPPALVIEEPLPPQPAVPPMSRRATPQKAEVDAAPQGKSTAPESSATSIVLGTHPYIFEQFRQELAAFEEEFSDRQLSLDFDCYVVDQVAIAFSEARIDLALFYARGETRTLPSDYLWSERWSLFVGAGHRLAHHGSVTRDDLAGEGLLLSAAGNRLRPITMACLEASGLGDLPVAAESDDHLFLAEDCRKGGGVLPLFGPAARRMGAMAGLRRLPYAHHIPPVEVRRAIHPRALGNMGAMALADLLKRSLA